MVRMSWPWVVVFLFWILRYSVWLLGTVGSGIGGALVYTGRAVQVDPRLTPG